MFGVLSRAISTHAARHNSIGSAIPMDGAAWCAYRASRTFSVLSSPALAAHHAAAWNITGACTPRTYLRSRRANAGARPLLGAYNADGFSARASRTSFFFASPLAGFAGVHLFRWFLLDGGSAWARCVRRSVSLYLPFSARFAHIFRCCFSFAFARCSALHMNGESEGSMRWRHIGGVKRAAKAYGSNGGRIEK